MESVHDWRAVAVHAQAGEVAGAAEGRGEVCGVRIGRRQCRQEDHGKLSTDQGLGQPV